MWRRQVITEDIYYNQVYALRSSCCVATKYVLSFSETHHYYELVFWAGTDQRLILDFGVEAIVPSWLQICEEVYEEDIMCTQEQARPLDAEVSQKSYAVFQEASSKTSFHHAENVPLVRPQSSFHVSLGSGSLPCIRSATTDSALLVESSDEEHDSVKESLAIPRQRSRSRTPAGLDGVGSKQRRKKIGY